MAFKRPTVRSRSAPPFSLLLGAFPVYSPRGERSDRQAGGSIPFSSTNENKRLGNSVLLNLFFFDLLCFRSSREASSSDFRNDFQYHDGGGVIPQFRIFPIQPIDLFFQLS